MKNTFLLLMMGSCLLWCRAGFSQTMSTTENTMTWTGACINPSTNTYSMELEFDDFDNGPTTLTLPCSVTATGVYGSFTLTVSGTPFPTVATRNWSLDKVDDGILTLTGGSGGGKMIWYRNPDGSIAINCSPLPIGFGSFGGQLSGNTVNLSWTTEGEQNSTIFEVYRASTAPGSSFYRIATVAAAGNSVGTRAYGYNDPNPAPDNLYQLKLLNSQGTPAVTSTIVRVQCPGCTYTPPTPVHCNYTINGPDYICSVEDLTSYSLSAAVPDFSSIAWSVDQPSQVYLVTYPNVDRTKVDLLKKNVSAAVTLTATLSGCSNAITKYVVLGTPTPYVNYSVYCPDVYAYAAGAPGATNYVWYLQDYTMGVTTTQPLAGASWTVDISTGHTYGIGFTYDNACGTSYEGQAYGLICDPSTGGGPGIPNEPVGLAMAPNPSRGTISIGLGATSSGLAAKASAAPAVATAAVRPRVYQVRVIDALGVVRKTLRYSGGMERVSVDLSDLNNGVYIIQVFDNKTWKSNKVVLAK